VVGLNDIDMPTFTRNGSFMDLTAAINNLSYKSALSPGHVGLGTYQGKEYGVPYWADLSVLWYNKQLFQKAGLDPNKPPSTYAEILADAQAINKLGGGVNGFTFAGDCQGCLGFTVQPGIWADGTHLTAGDIGSQTANITGNTALENALGLYRQMWVQHLVPDSDRTDNGPTWGQDFAAGKIGIMPGGYGQLTGLVKPSQLGTEFMDTPLPGANGGYSTFDGGDDFAIPAAAKNPSGAWEFIQWVLQTQQQSQYPDLGATPVRTDLLTPAFSSAHPEDAVALKALAKGYAPVTLVYDQMFNQAGGPWFQMFTTAVYNGDTPTALQQGQSGLTSLLQQASS
jgi:multiple sugar transport system substrate-binding protein